MKPIKDMNTFEYLRHEASLPRVDCESGVEAIEALARESKTVFLAPPLSEEDVLDLLLGARSPLLRPKLDWPSQTEQYEADRESNAYDFYSDVC